jgi:hypothetical protein
MNIGSQQHLEVRAYDDQGNIFSSLDGFRFDWQITQGAANMRRIKVKESHYRDHDHLHVDEKAWMQSDDFFFKALQKGYTELTVKILERGYEHVQPASIQLTIVDPFIVQPKSALQSIYESQQESSTFESI